MTSIVKTIKTLFICSVLFIISTYIISINTEMHFVRFHSMLVSNDFAFTISSGIFVSIFVVFLCKLYEYINQKYTFQQILWQYYSTLYGQFLIAQYNLQRIIENKQKFFPQVLSQQRPILKSLLFTIQSIDYHTFSIPCHHNYLEEAHNKFQLSTSSIISTIVDNFLYLEIAAHTDEINLLQKYEKISEISKQQLTHDTLLKMQNQIAVILRSIDEILNIFENINSKRFPWKTIKTNIIQYEEQFTSTSIDDFLKKTIITL